MPETEIIIELDKYRHRLAELDEYRHRVAQRTFAAVAEDQLTVTRAREALAELGIHATYSPMPWYDRKPGIECSDPTCTSCLPPSVTVERLDPLPPGTDLAAFKRRVFDLVTILREERDWCASGTMSALAELEVPVRYVYVDEDDEEFEYAG